MFKHMASENKWSVSVRFIFSNHPTVCNMAKWSISSKHPNENKEVRPGFQTVLALY